MAEVRNCLGRRAHDFAHRINNLYRLTSHGKRGKSAVNASSLSAGCLLGDTQSRGPSAANDAADTVAFGVSPDSYARVKPPLGAGLCLYRGPEECSFSNKSQELRINRNLPSYRTCAECWRALSCAFRLQQSSCRRCLNWRCGHFSSVRAYSGDGTRSEPLYKTKTGYYEILEVSPSATQAQIKTAYYKQSFIYHPDRNAGSEEATVRFSEISEAYSVLGHKGLRKKYDRGLLSLSDLTATVRPSGKDTTGSSARRQTESRRSMMGTGGRRGVFDFDEFFRSHYSEQLQRQRDIRVRKEEIQKKKQDTIADKEMGKMMEIGVGLLLAVAIGILINLRQG